MRLLFGLAVWLGMATTAFALDNGAARKIFDEDTKKVRSGDLLFDWKEYRLAAVSCGAAGDFDWHPVRNRFMQQMKDGDVQAALKSADQIKNHNMAEPEGHLLAMIALQKMGRPQDAAFERKVVDAFVQSILTSGDGKSSKTAYFVVDEGEEYFLLNVVLGIGLPSSQSLMNVDGHSFDLLKIKDREGKDQELWFNVDTSMNAMREALGEGKK